MGSFNQIANLIRSSPKIVILTGAGISTESGLPDFRSEGGFWTKNQPIHFQDFVKSEDQRRLSWLRNIELHNLLRTIYPNSGHELVVKILSMSPHNFLITQNIDGLHQESGVRQDQIIEIHGNANKAACLDCLKENPIQDFHDAVVMNKILPRCSFCKGLVKVATISFGQPLNEEHMQKATELSETCDLLIVIGSSLKVMPAGKLPGLTLAKGGKVAIFNREQTRYDSKSEVAVNDELREICMKLNKLI